MITAEGWRAVRCGEIRLIEILNDRGYDEGGPKPQLVVWERMNLPVARGLRGLIHVLWDLCQVDPSDLSMLFAGHGRLRIGFVRLIVRSRWTRATSKLIGLSEAAGTATTTHSANRRGPRWCASMVIGRTSSTRKSRAVSRRPLLPEPAAARATLSTRELSSHPGHGV